MTSLQSSASEDPAQVRRNEILEAAVALFAERGYQRTSVKEIAERAGIAPGTIYLYFESKRDLLFAIVDRLIGQAWDQTQAEMAQLDVEGYIAAVLHNVSDFVRQNRPFLQALVTEVWTDAELQDQFFNQILAPIFEASAGYLETQIAEGRARPCRVEVVILTISGSLIMLYLFRALAPDQFLVGFSEDALVDELTDLYLSGLRPGTGEGAS
jgi:AcrR family transcriptional regulator